MLTFPFNNDMYDQGLVVRVSRNEVIQYVDQAARRAEVADKDRDRLIDAVNKLSVPLVAVGAYVRSPAPDCKCPANLAGYVSRAQDDLSLLQHDDAVRNFPWVFDRLVRSRFQWAMALEVVND